MTLINSLSVFETQTAGFKLDFHTPSTHNTFIGTVIDSDGCEWIRGEYILRLQHDKCVCLSPVENVPHARQCHRHFSSEDVAHSSASSSVIICSDFKRSAYEKPVCLMQRTV